MRQALVQVQVVVYPLQTLQALLVEFLGQIEKIELLVIVQDLVNPQTPLVLTFKVDSTAINLLQELKELFIANALFCLFNN